MLLEAAPVGGMLVSDPLIHSGSLAVLRGFLFEPQRAQSTQRKRTAILRALCGSKKSRSTVSRYRRHIR